MNSDKLFLSRMTAFMHSPRERGDKGGSISACAMFANSMEDTTTPPSIPPLAGEETKERSRGNAMIYILLALALLGALTMTMMRGNETGGDDLSEDQKRLYATQLIAQAASAKQVMDQMVMSGSNFNNIDFVVPSDPTFNDAPLIHKFYHPAGGGMVYKTPATPPFITYNDPPQGWYISKRSNVEWTPTTAHDVIFTAYAISPDVCLHINKIITGTETHFEHLGGTSQRILFANYAAAQNLDVTRCPTCSGYPQACVMNPGSAVGSYYAVILAR